jgi:hypothetical protein
VHSFQRVHRGAPCAIFYLHHDDRFTPPRASPKERAASRSTAAATVIDKNESAAILLAATATTRTVQAHHLHCLSHTASEISLLVSRWYGSPVVSLLEVSMPYRTADTVVDAVSYCRYGGQCGVRPMPRRTLVNAVSYGDSNNDDEHGMPPSPCAATTTTFAALLRSLE